MEIFAIMTNRILPTIILFLGVVAVLSGQHKGRCSSSEKMDKYSYLMPGIEDAIDRGYAYYAGHKNLHGTKRAELLYIPVHVIIVHAPGKAIGTGNNHSVSRINSQIAALNRDFNRLNADTINTPDVFSTGNPQIHFFLATVDPDGNLTDGITRYATNLNFDDEETTIKGATRWPRTEYLNIWAADIADLGFAYVPSINSLPNELVDGVTITHESFGGPNSGASEPYDLGRTATHEVGHYLGLTHVWRSNGCNSDDGFTDTPLQDDENYGCPSHPSPSCNNAGDMFMNYMDYVDDDCMNAFSGQQSDYMRQILQGIRNSVLISGQNMVGTAPLVMTIQSKVDVNCHNEATGQITVAANGGKAPYTYTLGTTTNNDGIFDTLVAGNYHIKSTDALGDSFNLDVAITQPDALVIDSVQVKNNNCFGDANGSVKLFVSGGVPFSGKYLASVNNGSFATTSSFTKLKNNEYNFIIKDSKQCTLSKNIVITSPPALEVEAKVKALPKCAGSADGTVLVAVIGGSPSYKILMDGTLQNENVIPQLKAGTYILQVLDTFNCEVKDTLTLAEPEIMTLTLKDIKNIPCYGQATGSFAVKAGGGTPGYLFSLNGGASSVDSVFQNLPAGTYALTLMDQHLCQTSDTVTITEGTQLIIQAVDVQPDLNGSFVVTIHGEGGSGDLRYYVDDKENLQPSPIFSGINTGNHVVGVVDSNDCEITQNVVVSSTNELIYGEFRVGPNPVKDNLALTYSGNKNEEVDIEIYDISGKLVYEEHQILFSQEKNIHNIFVNNLVNSIFIFKIASKFKSGHIKIYKE